MSRPLVGIIGNSGNLEAGYPIFQGGKMNVAAVAEVSQCMPVIVPADPAAVTVDELLARFEGFLFTGGRPNVHPEEYGEDPTEAHGAFDRARDAITLPLIRALIERGQPFFGICRGFQEVNVALGGSLYPEIRELPGRMNHRMPTEGGFDTHFSRTHPVHLTPGGVFHQLLGADEIVTNTLHGQGIKAAASDFVIEGLAEDGTPEAAYVDQAPGFTLSVQWHPEYRAAEDPVSRKLFAAFGDAARLWAARG